MSGGSFGYPRFKSADDIGRHNVEGMIALLQAVGLGESRAARDLRGVLDKLAEIDAMLERLEDVMGLLDRVPSGDDTVDSIPSVIAAYEAAMRAIPGPCPICEYGEPMPRTVNDPWRWSCGHWIAYTPPLPKAQP